MHTFLGHTQHLDWSQICFCNLDWGWRLIHLTVTPTLHGTVACVHWISAFQSCFHFDSTRLLLPMFTCCVSYGNMSFWYILPINNIGSDAIVGLIFKSWLHMYQQFSVFLWENYSMFHNLIISYMYFVFLIIYMYLVIWDIFMIFSGRAFICWQTRA